jgi:cyclic-di-GMP phosphodiesterase, flagellum assembly factor TipF
MRRLSSIFVALCMVLIAGSFGGILFLAFKLDAVTAAIAALCALVCMTIYNVMSNRMRDRTELGDQIADLSRGTADLAKQVAEIGRRLNAVETNVSATVNKARGAVDPLAQEIGELGTLVRQLADTVAGHDAALRQSGVPRPIAPVAPSFRQRLPEPEAEPEPESMGMPEPPRAKARWVNAETVLQAIEEHRIDLYLQPIVTLPQRKVRYYEALSRLRTDEGEVVAAADFIEEAEAGGLMPRIDNLVMFRSVQVTRRLQLKSRDVGVFCNINPRTLTDASAFKQFLDFMDANRALSESLILEFTQNAYRTFGPIEMESLSALAERGFRFSMDHVADLRLEPRELAERSFRFLKVPAKLLLNRGVAAQSDIHPEDLADLLARSGIDLVAERIENESMVLDLLDYDVRFGQGFLFSQPRPVRNEALGMTDAQATTAPAA